MVFALRPMHARLSHARLSHARLPTPRLPHAGPPPARLPPARLSHARLSHARLSHARLSLSGAAGRSELRLGRMTRKGPDDGSARTPRRATNREDGEKAAPDTTVPKSGYPIPSSRRRAPANAPAVSASSASSPFRPARARRTEGAKAILCGPFRVRPCRVLRVLPDGAMK